MRFHVGGLLFTSALVQGALVNRGDRSKLYAARKRKLARQSGEPIAAAAEEPVVRRNLRSLQGIGLKTLDAGALKKNKGKRRSDGKKNSDTTAAMDVPVGVTLSDTEVEYGTPVTATFDIKTADVSLDALQRINVTKSDDWEVCLYMRMQNNEDSILCLPADVKGEATVDEATGIPDLDMTAEVTLKDTSAETLPEALYGLGFDVYLQDENGVKIIGPGTFYLSPTAEMIAAADEEVSARETVHVVKGNHFKGKHYTSPIVAMKAHKVAKLTAAESPALAKAALDDKSYTLSTDKWAYYQTESVVVSYDLTAAAGGDDRRNLKKRGKNKNKGIKVSLADTKSTTTVAATTAATSSSGTDATGTESSSTTTASTPPADPYEGEGADVSPADEDFEVPVVDDSDVSLWTIAVYDRMANPQGGKLAPYVSRSLGDLAGTWEFNVSELGDALLFDGQYDIRVLNGSGDGIAGPVTFKVVEAEEEER